MADRSWKSVIIEVLSDAKEPLHYREITERILSRGLKTTEGATPDATVGAQITASIKHDGMASPFIKVGKGTFALRPQASQPTAIEPEPDGADEVIRAFGMYWQRELVVWRRQPKLYGRQQVAVRKGWILQGSEVSTSSTITIRPYTSVAPLIVRSVSAFLSIRSIVYLVDGTVFPGSDSTVSLIPAS
jgi:hypothetical protein